MPETIAYKIEGLDEVLAAMGEIAGMQWASQLIYARLGNIRQRTSVYPQETAGNKARAWSSGGNNRWYQRGYGPKWARKDGSVNGYQTSQMLNRGWAHYVEIQHGMLVGIVGNHADYAPLVHGAEQARIHADHGWRRLEDEAARELPKLTDDVAGKIAELWR